MNGDRVLAGIDGCRAGWVAVIGRAGEVPAVRAFPDFSAILRALPDDALLAVDMPIGLPATIGAAGRGPERAVRPRLGPRQSSVFSIPARAAVYAPDYRLACERALQTSLPPRKVSRQAFHLFPKIREIDAVMTRRLEDRIFEVHPELAFWRLNGNRPMALPKKIKGRVNPAGIDERRALLIAHGISSDIVATTTPVAAADDLADAAACFLIAHRLAAGSAEPFPDPPLRTERGARMAIWA